MGADAIQIHPTPPGFWGSPKLDENRIATFKEAAAKHGHPPFYFHAVYLINLAGDDPTLRQRSESTLAGYLKAADELGVNGVIFHTGSHKGAGFEARLPSITEHLQHVLERASPTSARLLIENNAGLGGCVGARFEEIAQMLDNDPRVSVCFDTCHAFASGYDERTAPDVKKTIDELDRVVDSPASRLSTATIRSPGWVPTATATRTSEPARSASRAFAPSCTSRGWRNFLSFSRCPARAAVPTPSRWPC